MRPIVFALPLLAATAVFAQNQTQSSPIARTNPRTAQVETSPLPGNAAYPRVAIVAVGSMVEVRGACPVGITARQQGGGQTVWTIALEDAGKARGGVAGRGYAGTGVHVELKDEQGAPIRQVELAVDFLAPGWRVMPVREADKGVRPGDDLKKTYNLAASDGASLRLAGDLLVGATGGITRVTLLRIEYANGTSWRADDHAPCSVAPNGFMLVGAR